LDIPILTTERLLLRGFVEDDLDAYAAITADAEVMRYLNGKPLDRARAWRSIAVILGHWQLRGYGIWALVDRASGQLVGRAGLHNPEGWPGLEVGWVVARSHWGQGLATEAGRAALDYAFGVLGAEHMISVIDPDNTASIRVAEKLGETFERQVELAIADHPLAIYGIPRDRWRPTGR
jgi:RimJ/RimL family protein N-acetyltransferase